MVVGRQDPVLGIFPEINLPDKTVGRRHAYVRNQQGQFTVEDLNALNKTRLNGVILTPHEERTLKDGDILRFGSVEVRFNCDKCNCRGATFRAHWMNGCNFYQHLRPYNGER